jgi:hypothetical protein
MEEKNTADLTHDQIVELAVRMGFLSENEALNRKFFRTVHLIVWKALAGQTRKQHRKALRQLKDELALERSRWMRKVQKASLS